MSKNMLPWNYRVFQPKYRVFQKMIKIAQIGQVKGQITSTKSQDVKKICYNEIQGVPTKIQGVTNIIQGVPNDQKLKIVQIGLVKGQITSTKCQDVKKVVLEGIQGDPIGNTGCSKNALFPYAPYTPC
jgi:hypothetical protein